MPSSKKKQRYHSEPLPPRQHSESPDSLDDDRDRVRVRAREQERRLDTHVHTHTHSHSNLHLHSHSHSRTRTHTYGHGGDAFGYVYKRDQGQERDQEQVDEEEEEEEYGYEGRIPKRDGIDLPFDGRPKPDKGTSSMMRERASRERYLKSPTPPTTTTTTPATPPSLSPIHKSSLPSSSSNTIMPARLDSVIIHQRNLYDPPPSTQHYYPRQGPSPPPIATLTHSPSLASDRSSDSSPVPTILPPLHPSQLPPSAAGPYAAPSPHRYSASSSAYNQPPPPTSHHHHHAHQQYYQHHQQQPTVTPTDVFGAPASPYISSSQPHYGGHFSSPAGGAAYTSQVQPAHHYGDPLQSNAAVYSASPYALQNSMYGGNHHHGPGPHGHGHALGGGVVGGAAGGGYPIIYTDDAATKLSDRVRRRCFNCTTTDTSTWRRSSLHPGKVLCNKCGLFERTHGRDRPEQFPHKRGTLTTASAATSAFPSRTPPSPPTEQVQNLPPAPSHPSLASAATSNSLPQIGEWLSGPGGGSAAGSSRSGSVQQQQRSYDSGRQSGSPHQHHAYQQQQQQQHGSPRSMSGGSVTGSPMMGTKPRHAHSGSIGERVSSSQQQQQQQQSQHQRQTFTRSPSPDGGDMLGNASASASVSPRVSGLPGILSDAASVSGSGSDYSRS